MDYLRTKTIVGSFWMVIERFGYLTIQFVSNLVLARLLMPSDFGTIGVLLIFTALSAVLIDSGLGAALVQKKQISDIDKSTVFYTNLILSLLVYILVFVSAPYIADYFRNQDIVLLLRVIEIMVIIDAFASIQSSLLSRNMDFKTLVKMRVYSILIAVSISIICALYGLGVWSLVIQYLVYSFTRAILLWGRSKWKPSLEFSLSSFNALFGYGSKLLLSQFISELYVNFQSILIGRKFTSSDLGYYTQARQLQQIPVSSLSYVVNSVSFPAFARLQDEKNQLLLMARQNLKLLVFINTPIMFLLAVIAKPLIVLLYSEKWIDSVPYFQFLCLGFGILLIIHQCSLSLLRASGRSDYVLKLEIIKKILGVILLVVGINLYGIWGILIGLTINSIIELFLNGFYLEREIGYSAMLQIIDFMPCLSISFLSSVIPFFLLNLISLNNLLTCIVVSLVYTISYLLISCFLKIDGMRYLLIIFNEYFIKRNKVHREKTRI